MGNGAILGKNNNKNCSIPQQFFFFFFFFPHIEINESQSWPHGRPPPENGRQKAIKRAKESNSLLI